MARDAPLFVLCVRRREDLLDHLLDLGVRVRRGRGEAQREREVIRAYEHAICTTHSPMHIPLVSASRSLTNIQ